MISPGREGRTATPTYGVIKRENGSIQAQLRRLYPTHESFDAAIKAFGSIVKLAEQLEINRRLLSLHKKWLDEGAQPLKKRIRHKYMTNSEIDDRINSLAVTERKAKESDAAFRYTVVKVYAITDDYIPGQLGTEGLVYLRTDISRAAIPSWRKVTNVEGRQ